MNLKTKVAGDTGVMEDAPTGDVQILLTSKEDPVSMRLLGVSESFHLITPKLCTECDDFEFYVYDDTLGSN